MKPRQVYQCTLYDINARGFVRPICLSFITSDPDKVMANFEELCREFSKVRCHAGSRAHAHTKE